ncbi:asparagine synthase (glutamine-hydrolyzing) [Altererythrobacter atlanticus]|uniref:asparagine synthase (glutamine-hydrolyzing) n=1 Tax=Croceibacterium atlanticum TaxID=1267766 RepID=A0A0F7KT60_9SPHN|nr:asparagine synthase-related protein [Croceibacterium atlanticum]AKH42784.1 Asparagine synthetase [glutamine-hydrolyzing] 3 [Croceibacterium atlanticum]MBB5731564.1 asparagine synthase (glutamine-hydrolyzing) [Croceibacterium atlanticum]
MILHTERRDGFTWEWEAGPRSGAGQGAAIPFIAPGLRLDNRAELASALGLPPKSDDETVLLAAWARWGEGMADRLRGPFAFAIADFAGNRAYLARDVFGLCPLYYHLDRNGLVVAGSSRLARAILGKDLPRDHLNLADFVQGQAMDKTGTIHLGIRRLPPAHYLIAGPQEDLCRRYWSFAQAPRQQSGSDAAEHFRALFDISVERAHCGAKPCLPLSGGLDSSSIAGSLAANHVSLSAIPTLTLTYRETANWNDAPYLAELDHRFGLMRREIAADRHDPLADMKDWLRVLDGPYVSYGHSVSSQLLPLSRELGCDTVLSGHGGDEVVSYGIGRLNELARRGDWATLWRNLDGSAGLFGQSRIRLFRKYLTHKPFFRRVERRLQRGAAQAETRQSLSDDLADLAGSDRYHVTLASTRSDHDDRMLQEEALDHPIQALSLETIAACSHASGVVTRMPFYDRELVECSLSLPSEWKLRHGLSRWIMRRAMDGRLPPGILARRSKFDFAQAFRAGLLDQREKILDLADPARLGPFVHAGRLKELRNRLSRNDTNIEMDDAYFLWRASILAMWIDIAGQRLERPRLLPLKEIIRQ